MRASALLGAAMLVAALPPRAECQMTTGRVVWHDLVTPDLVQAKAFYGGLFGWTWRAPSEGKGVTYVVAEMAGVAIGGLAESGDDKGSGSQWIPYFAVSDLKRSVKVADDSGGKVIVAATTTGSWHDESALLADAQGAVFGLMKPGAEPNDSAGHIINGWLWLELWTSNVDAAVPFYERLLGYQGRIIRVGGQPYTLMERDSLPRAGVRQIAAKGVRPNWLPTIRVADVDSMVARAVALGGRVIMAPRADVREGTVAIIADPMGAALTLQEWTGEQRGK